MPTSVPRIAHTTVPVGIVVPFSVNVTITVLLFGTTKGKAVPFGSISIVVMLFTVAPG
jgi:hypothetical protein